MTTSILHVSDSFAGINDEQTNQSAGSGGIDHVVTLAMKRDVDAVVHTGNLFQRPEPNQQSVDRITDELSKLAAVDIPFCTIDGYRERNRESEHPLSGCDAVTQLSDSPTVVGDVALYGVDYTTDEKALLDHLESLETTEAFTYNVTCLHEHVWPPIWEKKANVTAYDVVEAAEVHVNEVLAGGIDNPQSWESDDWEYRVSYPGSTNPSRVADGTNPRAGLLTAEADDGCYERVELNTVDFADAVAHLSHAIEYESVSSEDLDTAQIADLYGLVARAKSVFESRRKDLREELLQRVEEEREVSGQYATVRRTTRTRQSLRSESTVLETLEEYDVEPEEIMSVDSSLVGTVVDQHQIDEDAVFESKQTDSVRLSGLDLD